MFARILNLLTVVPLLLAAEQLKQGPKTHDAEFWNRVARKNIERKLRENPHLLGVKRPKNVILFIGDGMGIATVTSARINKNQRAGNPYLNEPLFFEKFSTAGLVKTSSLSNHVTDSAAGGTALFTGRKVDSKMLGLKPKTSVVCTNAENLTITDGIVEGALENGLAVGFVTTTRVTHATPGALYAKGIHREIENDVEAKNFGVPNCTDIAQQLLSYPASEFKVIMGGGRDNLADQSRGGLRNDGLNVDLEWSKLGGNRRVISDIEALHAHRTSDEKLLGVFSASHFPMYLEERMNGTITVPRLSEMTVKAIQQLQQEENGFFLMVEGGNIDNAEHSNQMHLAFGELYEFEEAIRKAKELTDPSETLIVVTADHAHAVTLPGYLPVEKSLFSSAVMSYKIGKTEKKFELPAIFFATGPGYRGGFETTDKSLEEEKLENPLYTHPSSVPMKFDTHGGEDVGIWADGPLSHLFSSSLENTEVAYIIKFLLCARHMEYTFCEASMKISESRSFVEDVIQRLGSDGLLLLVTFLLAVTILSLVIAVSVVVLMFVQNKRSSRFSQCNSETTLVRSSL